MPIFHTKLINLIATRPAGAHFCPPCYSAVCQCNTSAYVNKLAHAVVRRSGAVCSSFCTVASADAKLRLYTLDDTRRFAQLVTNMSMETNIHLYCTIDTDWAQERSMARSETVLQLVSFDPILLYLLPCMVNRMRNAHRAAAEHKTRCSPASHM